MELVDGAFAGEFVDTVTMLGAKGTPVPVIGQGSWSTGKKDEHGLAMASVIPDLASVRPDNALNVS